MQLPRWTLGERPAESRFRRRSRGPIRPGARAHSSIRSALPAGIPTKGRMPCRSSPGRALSEGVDRDDGHTGSDPSEQRRHRRRGQAQNQRRRRRQVEERSLGLGDRQARLDDHRSDSSCHAPKAASAQMIPERPISMLSDSRIVASSTSSRPSVTTTSLDGKYPPLDQARTTTAAAAAAKVKERCLTLRFCRHRRFRDERTSLRAFLTAAATQYSTRRWSHAWMRSDHDGRHGRVVPLLRAARRPRRHAGPRRRPLRGDASVRCPADVGFGRADEADRPGLAAAHGPTPGPRLPLRLSGWCGRDARCGRSRRFLLQDEAVGRILGVSATRTCSIRTPTVSLFAPLDG